MVYKLLADIESLEAQHQVSSIVISYCSVLTPSSHSDPGSGSSSQASLAFFMCPRPGLAPVAFLSLNELTFYPS